MGQQVHEARSATSSRLGAEQDREHVSALLTHLVVGQFARRRGAATRPRAAGATAVLVGCLGLNCATTSPSPQAHRRGQRVAAEDQDLAVVVRLDVAADELDRDRLTTDADGQRVADPRAERVVQPSAGDRLALGVENSGPAGTA